MTIELLHCHTYDNIWVGTDTEERFQQNLKSQPLDWPWRNQTITYRLNSQNYRAPEWDTIDWSNSIVMFGCSQVFGVGVNEDQTLGHYLSQLLNKPVINLGIPGGSIMALWINTEKLLNYGINPLAVIYNWPSANRSVELIGNKKNRTAGPWIFDWPQPRFGKEWLLHPTHGFEYAKYAVMSAKRSWSCPQLHYCWDHDTAKFLGIPRMANKLDYARDCLHEGPATWKDYATKWYYELLPKLFN
jgi:hypothetical protein